MRLLYPLKLRPQYGHRARFDPNHASNSFLARVTRSRWGWQDSPSRTSVRLNAHGARAPGTNLPGVQSGGDTDLPINPKTRTKKPPEASCLGRSNYERYRTRPPRWHPPSSRNRSSLRTDSRDTRTYACWAALGYSSAGQLRSSDYA